MKDGKKKIALMMSAILFMANVPTTGLRAETATVTEYGDLVYTGSCGTSTTYTLYEDAHW